MGVLSFGGASGLEAVMMINGDGDGNSAGFLSTKVQTEESKSNGENEGVFGIGINIGLVSKENKKITISDALAVGDTLESRVDFIVGGISATSSEKTGINGIAGGNNDIDFKKGRIKGGISAGLGTYEVNTIKLWNTEK